MNKKTKILKADQEKDILEAVSMLQKGQLIAVPTETVYGLAADARNIEAVEEIFRVKNRPSNHPLIIHIASFEHLSEWAQNIPPIAAVLAKNFWPGPLTLLLEKNELVHDVVTGGLTTIALRIPENKALLKILTLLNTGLAAPSANPYKRISPTSPEHVLSGLSGKIDAVLDDGACIVGIESTILDLTKNKITILRHGPVTKAMLEDVLQVSIDSPLTHSESVSGNMKAHYQPYTKTSLMSLDELQNYVSFEDNHDKIIAIIHYSDLKLEHANIKTIQLSKNKNQYTKMIYNALHELDLSHSDQILVETPPNEDEWNDVRDRLSKACASDDE